MIVSEGDDFGLIQISCSEAHREGFCVGDCSPAMWRWRFQEDGGDATRPYEYIEDFFGFSFSNYFFQKSELISS